MKHNLKRLLACVLTVMLVIPYFGTALAASPITLPDLISDNMLIQRDMPVKLWGYGGTPGETLAVEFEDEKGNTVNEGTTTIGDDGFNIELPAMEAGGPYTIRFLDDKGDKLASVYNVLIGELWYQGGQSNMQLSISAIPDKIAERVNPAPKDDTIRLFFNGSHFTADKPATDIEGKWVIADKNLKDYSAVGYKALETMHNELGIPVGGICTPYGGSSITSFSSEDAGIYKAKLAPVTQFNIKGVMWYQGETNRDAGIETIESIYNQLITFLRGKWNNEKLPFVIVQLHPSPMKGLVYDSTTEYEIKDFSDARVAIGNVYAGNDNVGMAVAYDLSTTKYRADGEDPSHPYIKAPLGERLGNVALSMVYGKDIDANSPLYTSKTVNGNALTLKFADTYDGLKTTDGSEPKGFMIAGDDGVYYEAKAVLSGDTVTLTSDKVANPVNASYGLEKHYFPYPGGPKDQVSIDAVPDICELTMNVVNSAGLPVAAFDTATSIGESAAQAPAEQERTNDTQEEAASETVKVEEVESIGNKTVLYIAPDGRDTNAGTIDAPFASFEKARDTIRSMRSAGTLGEGGAVVYVRGGEYLMSKGVEFTEEDSGTISAPVTFRNYPGEEVMISGAIDVDFASFKKLTDEGLISRLSDKSAAGKILYINLYDLGLTDIPEPEWRGVYTYTYSMPSIMGKKKPDAVPSELLVNGKAQTVARYPNNDYLVISQVDDTGEIVRNWEKDKEGTADYIPEAERTTDPMIFRITDVRARNWTNADELLVYGTFVHSWADQTLPVAKIDPSILQITTKYPSVYGCAKDQLVYFYNIFEEIDSPGEYYIDRKTGNLYWYPVNETIESVNLTVLEEYAFTLRNVKNFTIRGFNIQNVRAGMVQSSACENVSVLDCEMSISGRRAITFSSAKNCRIANNYIHNVEGGVTIGGGEKLSLTPGNNVVENNEFYACDRLTKQQTPAIILEGVGNKILYNKIGEAEQMLVQFSGNDHLIAFNEIYDGCKNTDDIGAIYAGRSLSQRGNKIFYNYFHDIGETTRGNNGVHAIFLDDWWSWAHINGNVFENILGAGVMCAGSYNTITNNIFANIGNTSCALTRSYDYGSATNDSTLRNSLTSFDYLNDVWVERYPEIVNGIAEDGKLDINNYITAKNNVLYKAPEPRVSFEISQTALIENNKTYTDDPGFVDLAGRNYTLKQDSKVFTDIEGFQPIPFTRMGLYSQRAIHRVKDSAVFAANSPDAIINGEHTNTEYDVLTINGNVYVPVRVAAQLVEGAVSYDEATRMISVSSSTQQLLFAGGGVSSVTVNGEETSLENSTVSINGTNYLSVQDIAKCFGKTCIEADGVYVVANEEDLIDAEGDAELVRYYNDILSIY